MIIRDCRAPDVALLEQHLPSPGPNRYLDDHGIRHEIADPCGFLVKPIHATG
jgi:hypothetical protein